MGLDSSQKIRFTLILLFSFNLFMGLIFINDGIFHHDSIVLARAVEDTCRTVHLHPAIRGRYGMVIINTCLYLPFYLLGKNAEFVTLFSSILFHSLSIAALFLFTHALFDNYIQAFFCSALFSFTPFYFSPNTYGKEHGAAVFFLLLAFYLLRRGTRENSLPLISWSSFVFAFAVSIREGVFIALPLYLLLYLSPEISNRPSLKIYVPIQRLKAQYLFALAWPFLLMFGLMWFTYFKNVFYEAAFLKSTASNEFLGLFSPLLKTAMQDLSIAVPVLLFLFAIIGGAMIYKKDIFLALFLFLWFMLIFYIGNISSYAPRYLDIIIIPVYISAAYALAVLYERNRYATGILLLYFLLSMFIFMQPMLTFRHHYNGEKQFALYVKEKVEPNAVIISMDDSPFIEYYAKRQALCHPISDKQKMPEFIREINKHLFNKTPVYLMESGLSYDPGGAFAKAISGNFETVLVGSKLSEDYHRTELKLDTYEQRLFRLYPRKQ